MKGCILLQGNYAKIGHTLAIQLKKELGDVDFCSYIISPRAKRVMEEQSDFKYTGYLFDGDVHEEYTKENIDADYLADMEAEFGDPNFWRYLYTDRRIMMSFDSLDQRTMGMDPLYSHEDMQKIVQVRLRKTIEFLEKEKPNFIVFFAIGAIGTMMLYHIAKRMGIKVLVIDAARVGDNMVVTEDFNTFSDLGRFFKELRNGDRKSNNIAEAKKLLTDFRKTHSLSLGYMATTEKPEPVTFKKRFLTYFKIWQESHRHNREHDYAKPASLFRFFWVKIADRFRRLRGFHDLVSLPNKADKFAFFPLHFEPETSLLNIAPFASDQIAIVRMIARSLPINFKLYVKEHPAMVHKRERSYYKELLKIPNVILVDPKIKSFDLILDAKLILTITSTTGWESLLLGKPVISFGHIFYNEYPGVRYSATPELLPQLVNDQLNGFVPDEDSIIDFVASLMDIGMVQFSFYALERESDFANVRNNRGIQDMAKLISQKLSHNYSV
ncbi:MAG: hypothetical protein KBD73_00660 [Candidatus Magasanikbacteria bacterium]|nr:hypothetical protein [Candidatus Magasanikbacteria bacterium]